MEKMKQTAIFDTLLRNWAMLRMIPRWPRKIATPEIHSRLKDEGFTTTIRTVQRDLEKLSIPFQLYGDEYKPRGWCWAKDSQVLDLPAMDPQTALTLQLIADHAGRLFPPATLKFLQPHLNLAKRVLDSLSGSSLSEWPEKIRVIHSGPLRLPPDVNPEVMDVVYTALLENKWFTASYRAKDSVKYREYRVNPLGLVFKDGLAYLVATLMNYTDVRQLALHRFQSTKPIEEERWVPEGFTLDDYIAGGAFGYPEGELVNVKMLLDPEVVRFVDETAITPDQKLTPQKDGRILLEFTMTNNAELRWWILSYGASIEVLEPLELREKMERTVVEMVKVYSLGK
jgi:hypothetical protein